MESMKNTAQFHAKSNLDWNLHEYLSHCLANLTFCTLKYIHTYIYI